MKYEESGVSIDKANRALESIRRHVKSTWGRSVLSDVGAFGGLFSLAGSDVQDPVLVSSIDGVGTKLLVAVRAGRFDTVGQDLVNHCVNDILVQGASPLFFLDYFATGKLDPAVAVAVVAGFAQACRENGCALIGGETAEMPDVYKDGDFDLAGCIVGVVSRSQVIDGSTIRPGDPIYALPSNGLHTNGYSLVRRIVFDKLGLEVDDRVDVLGCTVAEELLRVHRSYLEPVRKIRTSVRVKGLAHITGGGVVENLPRILPEGCQARLLKDSWSVPPVFDFLQRAGDVDEAEMYRVFNMGLGMLIVVDPDDEAKFGRLARSLEAVRVGEIVSGKRRVELA